MHLISKLHAFQSLRHVQWDLLEQMQFLQGPSLPWFCNIGEHCCFIYPRWRINGRENYVFELWAPLREGKLINELTSDVEELVRERERKALESLQKIGAFDSEHVYNYKFIGVMPSGLYEESMERNDQPVWGREMQNHTRKLRVG